MKKYLEADDDTILLCMVSEPNPEFPDYYSPDPEFIFPITRSYLRNLYNPLEEDGTYKNPYTNIAYRCAKDIEGLEGDLTFNVTMNQLYLLKPYFKITGVPQDIYINTRDAMMLMYSKHKVFSLRKETEIPINAGINIVNVGNENVFGQVLNVVSADHCQSGSNKPIFRVMMADIDEYTEVERQELQRKVITIEDVYQKYPEAKEIVDSSQPKQQKILAANRLDIPSEYKTRVVQTIMQDRTEVMVLEPQLDDDEPRTLESFLDDDSFSRYFNDIVEYYNDYSGGLSDEEINMLETNLEVIDNFDDLEVFLEENEFGGDLGALRSILRYSDEPNNSDTGELSEQAIYFSDYFDAIVQYYEDLNNPLSFDQIDYIDEQLEQVSDFDQLLELLDQTIEQGGGFVNDIDEDDLRNYIKKFVIRDVIAKYFNDEFRVFLDDPTLQTFDSYENIDDIVNHAKTLRSGFTAEDEQKLRAKILIKLRALGVNIESSPEQPLARQLDFGDEPQPSPEQPLARQLDFGDEPLSTRLDDDMDILEPE